MDFKSWDVDAMIQQIKVDMLFGLGGTIYAVIVVRPAYNVVSYIDGWTDHIHCPRWEFTLVGLVMLTSGIGHPSEVQLNIMNFNKGNNK
jgi:hypothetical protein